VEPPATKEDGTRSKPASRTGREAWESAAEALADFILDHRPEGVSVADEGTLVDGQHRHNAVLAALKEASTA
jgi:hypothetical protein